MSEITVHTKAYAKLMLHAAKYPYCAVNGILLADASNIKEGAKNQDYEIVDAIPLFHHSHYVTPMAEVALTQIETMAQSENMVIAGYYVAGERAACGNNAEGVESYPGQKIADKIADFFPSAVYFVIDNSKLGNHHTHALMPYKHTDGKWKLKDNKDIVFQHNYYLNTVSQLIERGVQKDLVDFDNHLDDMTMDWANIGINKVIASVNASNSIDYADKNEH